MKKAILIICTLFMTSALSARVFFQTDMLLINNQFEYNHNCFTDKQDSFDYDFLPFNGIQFALGYELFTDRIENKFHFFGGAELGSIESFISIGGFAGFNYHLFDLSLFKFELMTTLKAGQISGIKGPTFYYIQTNLDFVTNLRKRRFPYFGVGISNVNTTNINIYKDYGYNLYLLDNLSLHMCAGIRF